MKDEIGVTFSTHVSAEKSVHNFSGKPEGKRELGKSGHSWEDSIKIKWPFFLGIFGDICSKISDGSQRREL
jgi:hypothetical protein